MGEIFSIAVTLQVHLGERLTDGELVTAELVGGVCSVCLSPIQLGQSVRWVQACECLELRVHECCLPKPEETA